MVVSGRCLDSGFEASRGQPETASFLKGLPTSSGYKVLAGLRAATKSRSLCCAVAQASKVL